MKKSSTLRRRSRLYELCKLLVCLTNFVCLVSLNNLFKTYQKLKFKSALDYPPICYRYVSDGCVTQFWLRQLFTLYACCLRLNMRCLQTYLVNSQGSFVICFLAIFAVITFDYRCTFYPRLKFYATLTFPIMFPSLTVCKFEALLIRGLKISPVGLYCRLVP